MVIRVPKRVVYINLFLIFMFLPQGVFSVEESEFEKQRYLMVENQIKRRGISDEATLKAILTIPRHQFVPQKYIEDAYGDHPLPIGEGQTISQPYIVALMTEQLKLKPSDKVLEIGTGSGYQAAVLSQICEEVYTIEIIPFLGEEAKKRLKDLGYDNIVVKIGDGYYGWEKHTSFDAIIVTAAATHIPPPLIKQLKVGGRMVIPIGGVFQVQRLMFIEKKEDGKLISKNLIPVRFVPLTGERD